MTLCEISFHADVPYTTLCWRIRNGWTVEEAVSGKRVHQSVIEYTNASNQEYISQMRYTTAEAFDLYKRWCDKEGFDAISNQADFTKQMQNLGWGIKRSNGKRYLKWE